MSSQPRITSFFGGKNKRPEKGNRSLSQNSPRTKRKRQRLSDGSSFGACPLCNRSFPLHKLEDHAASCTGLVPSRADETVAITTPKRSTNSPTVAAPVNLVFTRTETGPIIQPDEEPVPGLFIFKNFITEEEESQILAALDGTSSDPTINQAFHHWHQSKFNGKNRGKRWGVHCDLRERQVKPAERPLPRFMLDVLLPRFQQVASMNDCTPNEANAIDYRKSSGDYLKDHVDDRKLSKEPIANLSLAGDCYMTFCNVAQHRNVNAAAVRVFLPRRCLQVLTGKARYEFSHGIQHADLLSPRRVSVTMRESPLTVVAAVTKTEQPPRQKQQHHGEQQKDSEHKQKVEGDVEMRLQENDAEVAADQSSASLIDKSPEQPSISTIDCSTQRSASPCETKTLTDSRKVTPQTEAAPKSATSNTTSPGVANNVFTRMMKQSKTVFSQSGGKSGPRQYFCLNAEHEVELNTSSFTEVNLTWSTTVRVKDGPHGHIEVLLGTSLPICGVTATTPQPQASSHQWVRRHSRLSVPVLKSILQKSIRRRRPLPAVRVAMELADKDLSALLRRLPIICLEDATLHPKLPLLVWLMMAQSKDFVIPTSLMHRVWQIIYEITSCPWMDTLQETYIANDDSEPLSMSKLLKEEKSLSFKSPSETMFVWSMLARAAYGGMKGDVRMLHGYARQFWDRFKGTAAAVALTSPDLQGISYREVIRCIYQTPQKQSASRVAGLLSSNTSVAAALDGKRGGSLERLTMEHVCAEGVDFHCSSVLESIIQEDTGMIDIAMDLLALSGENNIPRDKDGRRAYLIQILRSCMWKYSAGINHRRPLARPVASVDANDASSRMEREGKVDPYAGLWKELAAPKALEFQRRYIAQRLAR